jgi:cell division protein FtsQ
MRSLIRWPFSRKDADDGARRPGARRRPAPAWRGRLILGAAFGLCAGAAVAGGWWAWRSGAAEQAADAVFARLDAAAVSAGFTVQEVFVVGRSEIGAEELRRAVGARRGESMLAFDPGAARERLLTLGWVKEATVRRRLPNALDVHVVERRPFALWQHEGRLALVDRDGLVVETETLDAFGPLPLVVGAGAEKHAAALYDLLLAHRNILERTQALVRVGERRWNLRLHSGTDVLLPEGHEAPALNRLAELQTRNALLDRPLVAVDMRLPDRLVVRQQPATEQPAQRRNAARSTRG